MATSVSKCRNESFVIDFRSFSSQKCVRHSFIYSPRTDLKAALPSFFLFEGEEKRSLCRCSWRWQADGHKNRYFGYVRPSVIVWIFFCRKNSFSVYFKNIVRISNFWLNGKRTRACPSEMRTLVRMPPLDVVVGCLLENQQNDEELSVKDKISSIEQIMGLKLSF